MRSKYPCWIVSIAIQVTSPWGNGTNPMAMILSIFTDMATPAMALCTGRLNCDEDLLTLEVRRWC